MDEQTQILTGRVQNDMVVKVVGPATYGVCPTVRRLIEDEVGHSPRVWLEMGEATWLDSTFAGCLTQFARGKGSARGSRLVLVGMNERCRSALAQMALESLFETSAALPASAIGLAPVPTGGSDPRALGEVIASAHEELADIDEEHARIFGPVARAFRNDLARRAH